MNSGKRNLHVDALRGIAMLLVVLGHTMTGCTTGSDDSFLYNIVWSLQMPLFILISGYVTRYSRGITDGAELWKYVKRRTIAYIFPWAVWSFIVRGVIFGEKKFLDIKWLLWHMDSGYWFLATIWTISMIFGISTFIARKSSKDSELKQQVSTLILYIVGMVVLIAVGFVAGLSFFAIKLTLYYMPFYFAGYLYGQHSDKILEISRGKTIIDVVVAVCFTIWLIIITRYHLYALPDSGVGIILRFLSSGTGCIAVCGLFKAMFDNTPESVCRPLRWIGSHSLEIYLFHYLLLDLLLPEIRPGFPSIVAYCLIAANFIITNLLCVGVICLISQSSILKKILGMK